MYVGARGSTNESGFVIEDAYIKGANKSWARLIKKIYEVDPLILDDFRW